MLLPQTLPRAQAAAAGGRRGGQEHLVVLRPQGLKQRIRGGPSLTSYLTPATVPMTPNRSLADYCRGRGWPWPPSCMTRTTSLATRPTPSEFTLRSQGIGQASVGYFRISQVHSISAATIRHLRLKIASLLLISQNIHDWRIGS